jgi:citrate synthase
MSEQKKGLEGIVIADTKLSRVMGDVGRLIYSGYEIAELAENACFEEIIYLLWHLKLPTQSELNQLRRDLFANMALSSAELDVMQRLPVKAHPMAALRTGVSMAGMFDAEADDNSIEANKRKAMRLTAKFPTIIAAWGRIRQGEAPLQPREDLGIAGNFLYMLRGKEPTQVEIDALNVYLVLLADHGSDQHGWRYVQRDHRRYRIVERPQTRRRKRSRDANVLRDRVGG